MSTPTLTRPGSTPAPTPPAGGPPRTGAPAPRASSGSGAAAFGARSAAGRTFRTWLGHALGLTPLFMIIDDARWYVVGIGATIVTVGPAWALRWWRPDTPARLWHLLPGVVLLPFYLTAVCVPRGAIAGLIPTKMTWTQLSLLHDELVDTIAKSTAPIQSTPGVRLALAVLLGFGIVMVDVLCTVLEAPAMVGLVLLPVYVLSGATVREPVSLWWFVLAAIGYLLILTTTGPEARNWGRVIGRRPFGAPPSLVSGRTIGAIAIVIAVILPLLSGGTGSNVIADALKNGSGDGGGGGSGTGGVTEFASLKGSLTRGEAIDLMTVHVPAGSTVEPFYLRQSVLDLFTGDGWIPASLRSNAALALQGMAQQPARPDVDQYDFRADIDISGLDGRPVTFGDTTGAAGLPDGARWDPAHGTFTSTSVSGGTRYSVEVAQPDPTAEQFATATNDLPANFPVIWRNVPEGLDPLVAQVTQQVVGTQTNPYEIARALSTYFTDSANGFRYTLDVPAGDSDDDVANFLRNKQGFCQQFAASMAVMLRVAGVPSRVVVGYTHVAADKTGRFTVTTRDAHAWVEAYLGGLGWIAFDPTPLGGTDAARSVALPWMNPQGVSSATGATGASTGGTAPTSGASATRDRGIVDGGPATLGLTAPAAPNHTGRWVALWVVVAIVVVLLLVPGGWRRVRRRERRRVTGEAVAEARYSDLRDTCVDLGLDWSAARSPRAVGVWLTGLGVPTDAATPLLGAVEQSRYGRTPPQIAGETLNDALDRTGAALRGRTRRLDRLRAAWWPRSVTQDIRARSRARVDGVRQAFTAWSNRPAAGRGLRRSRP